MTDRYQIIKHNDVDSCLWDTCSENTVLALAPIYLVEAIFVNNSEDTTPTVFGLQGK